MTSTTSPAPEVDQLLAVPLAHRGLHSADAPENSLAALQRAIDAGIGIELDVRLSVDGVPVVHHDATLDRMCAVPTAVNRMPASALTRLRLGGTEHRLPSLTAAMHLVGGAVSVLVDVKSGLGRIVAWTVRSEGEFRLAQQSADAVIVEDEAVELALASL
jgi:hypothetical protein